jgi:hemolysin activation/secretion protein
MRGDNLGSAETCFSSGGCREPAGPKLFARAIAATLLVAASSAFALSAAPLSAQIVASPPTRGELLPPSRQAETSQLTLTIDGDMERAPCALDRPEYSDLKLTLAGAEFVGLDRVPGLSLDAAYEGYVGRELPLSVLCDIRAQANSILRSQGYLATVEIPEQSLADGAPDFQVVFGRLTSLRVRGEAGPSEGLVASYLEKLTEQDVFNSFEAERYLLLADDLPGLDVRLSLRPAVGGQPGDLAGEIAVLQRSGSLDVNVQNFGSKALGRYGGLIRGELYDLTGLGDRTTVAAFSTLEFEEQQTFQLGHDFRIGSEGLRLGGQFTYNLTDPATQLAGFDIESETILASVHASYPLKRSRRSSLFADVGFELIDQDVEVNSIGLTRDRTRMVFARLSGEWTDQDSIRRLNGFTPFEPRFRAFASVEARQGLDVFGASPDCRSNLLTCLIGTSPPPSRVEADPTPLVVRLDAGAEYRPEPLFTFSLEASGQVASGPLPAFEEFAAGSFSIGRGYDPGSVLGDNGIAGAFELRFGSLAPKDTKALALQPYVFTDIAYAWNKDPSLRGLNPDHLWSTGGGVRAAWGSRLQGDVILAIPLARTNLQTEVGDIRLMFSLTARLFPWGD